MSAPPTPDQSPSGPHQAGQPAPGHQGKPDPGKLLGAIALVVTGLAALIIGIAIGNAARKRFDKLTHAYA